MTNATTDFDVQGLLAEEEFVRRLARGLLFDEHRVDDVVQQTWIKALQHRPQGAVRGWLAAVVKNAARDAIRGERRRAARERTAAVPESAVGSTAAILEREAIRRQVVEGLVQLPDAYRTVVAMRYLDGMPPREIAKRLELPGTTVRTRISRGLEQLRKHLDGEHGDRRSWCLALLPLARTHQAAALGASWWALLALPHLWLGLLVAGLGVGAFFVFAGAPAEPAPAVARVGVHGAPADRERSRELPDTGPSRAPSAAALVGVIAGRAVRETGDPEVDAAVRLFTFDTSAVMPDPFAAKPASVWQMFVARTDGQGRFRFATVPADANCALLVGFGGAHAAWHRVRQRAAAGSTVDVGDIVVAARGAVVGRVVTARGDPIAGAEVWAARVPAAEAQAVGLERLSYDGALFLAVPPGVPQASDLAQALRGFTGAPTGRFIVLAPAASARALFRGLPVVRARTGTDGSFRLAGLAPGQHVVVVRASGHVAKMLPRVRVSTARVRDVREVRMTSAARVTGTVVDHSGTPVAGAEVRLGARGALPSTLVLAGPVRRTDRDGKFAADAPRGKLLAGFRRDGDHAWHTAPCDGDDIVLRLPPPTGFALAVTGHPSVAVRGVEVRVEAGPPVGLLAGLIERAPVTHRFERADPDAHAVIEGLAPGVHTVHVRARGYAAAARGVEVGREDIVRITLVRKAPLDVVVVDRAGQPIAGATIRAVPATPSAADAPVLLAALGLARAGTLARSVGRTDAAGRARAELGHGAWDLTVRSPDHAPQSVRVHVPRPALRVELPAFGALQGVVTDGGKVPDAAWRVAVECVDAEGERRPECGPIVARLGARGAVHIAQVPPGPCRVHLERAHAADAEGPIAALLGHRAAPPFAIRERAWAALVVRPGVATAFALDANPARAAADVVPAELQLRVTVDGAPVRLELRTGLVGGTRLGETTTDGRFLGTGLVPGRTKLILRRPSSRDQLWQSWIELPAGERTRLDLALRTGGLRGRATLPSGAPAVGYEVEVEGALPGPHRADSEFAGQTDGDGRFAFAGLPAGAYAVKIHGPGGELRRAGAVVAAGATAAVEVQLTPLFALSGRVVWDGELPRLLGMMLRCGDEIRVFRLERDGSFRFTGLRSGRYAVEFAGPGQPRRRGDPAEIAVAAQDVVGVILRPGPLLPEDR